MDSQTDEKVKKVLRALLISSPNGLTVKQLLKDYEDMIGGPIPIASLGYPTPLDYVQNIPDTLQLKGYGLGALAVPVTTSKTAHLEEMIQNQKKPVKKARRKSGPVLNRPRALIRTTPKPAKKLNIDVLTPRTVTKINNLVMDLNSKEITPEMTSTPKSTRRMSVNTENRLNFRVQDILTDAALQVVESVVVQVVEKCVLSYIEQKFQELNIGSHEPPVNYAPEPKKRKIGQRPLGDEARQAQQFRQQFWHYNNYYNNENFAYNRNAYGDYMGPGPWMDPRFSQNRGMEPRNAFYGNRRW